MKQRQLDSCEYLLHQAFKGAQNPENKFSLYDIDGRKLFPLMSNNYGRSKEYKFTGKFVFYILHGENYYAVETQLHENLSYWQKKVNVGLSIMRDELEKVK